MHLNATLMFTEPQQQMNTTIPAHKTTDQLGSSDYLIILRLISDLGLF